MKFINMLIIALMLASCGSDEESTNHRTTPDEPTDERITKLEEQLLQLQGLAGDLSGIVNSEYDSCDGTGDTADPLILRICKVAKEATNEARVEMKGQLASYAATLELQLEAVGDDILTLKTASDNNAASITAINALITGINSSITTIQGNITTLQSQMTSAQSAITALQTSITSLQTSVTSILTAIDDLEDAMEDGDAILQAAINALQTAIAGITSTLNGTTTVFDIGSENAGAGPLYESVIRRVDKTRINGFVEAYGSDLSLPNNPIDPTNGSAIVTISMTAHGLVANDVVRIEGLSEGQGFTSGDLVGDFVVESAVVDSFTITLRRTATGSSNFGGNIGVAKKVLGRGMGTIWKTADGADVAVRKTSLGTKRYQYVVKANGDVCYSTTVPLATFATINAGGAGITCK